MKPRASSSTSTANRTRSWKEFADYRRGKPTPYMEKLRFTPGDDNAADPDTRLLSDEDLEKAVAEGKRRK